MFLGKTGTVPETNVQSWPQEGWMREVGRAAGWPDVNICSSAGLEWPW